MRHTTRSLLIAFGTAGTLVVTPLALDHPREAAVDPAVPMGSVSAPVTAPGSPAAADPAPAGTVSADATAGPIGAGDTSAAPGPPEAAPVPSQAAPAPGPPLSQPAPAPTGPDGGMGGDLPPGALPMPPYPECPITEEGAWWTDPSDPYTCIRPGSIPFYESTPPGIPPGLLEPIFEEPGTAPGPGEDCRLIGALQCTVTIMGEEYVVTFSDGEPVGVAEARP